MLSSKNSKELTASISVLDSIIWIGEAFSELTNITIKNCFEKQTFSSVQQKFKNLKNRRKCVRNSINEMNTEILVKDYATLYLTIMKNYSISMNFSICVYCKLFYNN